MRLTLALLFIASMNVPSLAQETKQKFPYDVDHTVISTGWGTDVLQVTVISLAFDMNIAGIVLNRGNCQIFENRVVDRRFVAPKYPFTLKYGLKRVFWTFPNCIPLDMVISTVEGGKFTLTFRSD